MTKFAEFAQGGTFSAVVTCGNGHRNPESRLFCADCGIAIVPTTTVCALGHVNAKDQHFCGDCGIPIQPPADAGSASSSGRWNVDPSTKHQYRYWDGVNWTQHVADNGTFSRDSFSRPTTWHPDTWVGVAAGVVTILLVVGAIVGIAMRLSSGSETSAAPSASSPSEASSSAAAPTEAAAAPAPAVDPVAPAAPPVPEVRPAAVVGTSCLPNSTPGAAADGSITYCGRVPSSNVYLWSLTPGDIPFPFAPGTAAGRQGDPGTAVCMAQTSRTAAQCTQYLQRPSDLGDGQPAE